MTPNGAIPCKLDTHVVKLSSGANSSTHTGGYTNNGACDKPVKNLENINKEQLAILLNRTTMQLHPSLVPNIKVVTQPGCEKCSTPQQISSPLIQLTIAANQTALRT